MKRYNPSEIEPKWQKIWEESKAYKAEDNSDKTKMYVAEMFPYPSGAGLHVGHVRNFTIVDVLARFYGQLGHNVLRTIGWDTFGLPAENYAIKTGISPQEATKQNIKNFKNQFKRLGMATDWDREVNTSHPEYYKWTQWCFLQLYKKGLAYRKESAQWWCPVDKTVLANEQVENGHCWRCGSEVEKKTMKQWFFKITAYADELLDDIDKLDWPEKIKTMQRNWIGRSEGAEIEFQVADLLDDSSLDTLRAGFSKENHGQAAQAKSLRSRAESSSRSAIIKVFTTRPDTIFGATFLVLAPEHELVDALCTNDTKAKVKKYRETAMKKSEIERQENKEKTGVFTGSYALNPATGEKMPIWVADYVLAGYGEGAIMAVPAHDERDFEFAEKFGLPIKEVVLPHYVDPTHPLREDMEINERQQILAIVHDPKTDKYLGVKWKKQPWTGFVVGGVEPEDDGDLEKAARREILEETGYKNLEFKRVLGGQVVVEYYAEHKGINRRSIASGVLFELIDDEQDKVGAEEAATQVPVWLDKNQLNHETLMCTELDEWLERMDGGKTIHHGEGVLVNSDRFDGMDTSEAREEIVAWLEQQGIGKRRVTYKMRDWLISRQRYWGCPIPIAYDKDGNEHAIPEDQLPVVLPEVKDYHPDDSGRSALAKSEEFMKVTIDGEEMTREADTMDGYACSSWYLWRYADARNSKQAWDPELANYWNPLDFYVGGDHAVAHLLYVRFWTKFFADEGLLGFREPVKKLLYNGYINAPDGKKMSKSKGNVIDPLELIDQGYGADALRTYEMFIGPYDLDAAWDPRGIGGVYRFLNRVWTVVQEYLEWVGTVDKLTDNSPDTLRAGFSKENHGQAALAKSLRSDEPSVSLVLRKIQNATTKKVTEDLHRSSFNTPIAALMEYVNELYKLKLDGFTDEWQEALEVLVKLVAPFAPHVAAELFEQLGHTESIEEAGWPKWDDKYLVADEVEIVVQVNGKLRGKFQVAAGDVDDEEKVKELAVALENVKSFTDSKQIIKVIYVKKNHLLNIVVK